MLFTVAARTYRWESESSLPCLVGALVRSGVLERTPYNTDKGFPLTRAGRLCLPNAIALGIPSFD